MPLSGSQPVRRPRPSLNCLICRDRKVRCGREQPECANCKKMGRECAYQTGLSSQRSTPQGVTQTRNPMYDEPSSWISKHLSKTAAHDETRTRQITGSFFGLDHILHPLVDSDKQSSNDPLSPHIDFLTIAFVLRSMPARSVCDALVEAFLTFIYSVYPLIDTAKFQSWYIDFWNWSGQVSQSAIIPKALLNDVTGNCHLFAILFAGAIVAPTATWMQPSLRQANKGALVKELKTAYLKTLSASDYLEHPTMSTIVSELIADPFMGREVGGLSNGLFLSSISRLAQSIGLHRESTEPDIDSAAQQHRRRVWQHIMWLDVQYSIASGIPLGCEVGLVNIPDVATEMPTQDGDSQDQYMVSLLLFSRSKIARLEHRFLKLVQNTHTIEEEKYQQLVSQAEDLDKIIQTGVTQIRVFLTSAQQDWIRDQTFTYSQWTHNNIAMSQYEIQILLETPFLQVPSDTDPEIERRWAQLAGLCVQYLRIYITLTVDESFQSYNWFLGRCAGPTLCVFLLLTHLRYYPNSEGAGANEGCVRDSLEYWDRAYESQGRALPTTQTKLKRLYQSLSTGVIEKATSTRKNGYEVDVDYMNDFVNI
ncbi:hypothetical protein BDV12DRAFT_200456 [Aspergillus spectabilis]